MNTSLSLYDAINEWCNGIPYLDATIGDAEIRFQGESSDLPLALVEYSENLARKRQEPFINDLIAAFSILGKNSAERLKLPNSFKIFELLVKLSSVLQEPRLLLPVEKLLSDDFLERLNDSNINLSTMLAESIFRFTYLTVYRAYIPAKKRAVDRSEFSAAYGIVSRLAENQYLNELHSVAAMFILNVCNADSIDRTLSLIEKIAKPERFTLPVNLPEAQATLIKSVMAAKLRIADTLPVLQRRGFTLLADQLFPNLTAGGKSGLGFALRHASPEVLLVDRNQCKQKAKQFKGRPTGLLSSGALQTPSPVTQNDKHQHA